jgi:hypothetical protein
MDRQKINQLIKCMLSIYPNLSIINYNLARRKSQPGSLFILAVQESIYFCLYHCYVFSLLSMLTWAILYHSVFGLIFLILACFLWALVNSRKWTFHTSPLILAYVQVTIFLESSFSLFIFINTFITVPFAHSIHLQYEF